MTLPTSATLQYFLRPIPVHAGAGPLGPDAELDAARYLGVRQVRLCVQAQVDETLLTCH